jgi:hypothetical protein
MAMKIERHRMVFAAAMAACLSQAAPVSAETESPTPAAQAYEKSVWDVSTALLTGDFIDALKAVRDTHDLIASKGATPDMVVLFRSMSPAQVARTEQRGKMIAPALIEESQTLLEELAKLPGVQLQTDARSLELLREEYRRVVSLIDDVYLALIAYQSQGYSLVTIYPLAGLR